MTKKFKFIITLLTILVSVSCNKISTSETDCILITYFPGVQYFGSKMHPADCEGMNYVPDDTVFVPKQTYRKIKDYIFSNEASKHSENIDVRLVVQFDTVKVYLGIYDHNYTPSNQVQEMEYIIKHYSKYYDYFTTDKLLNNNYCNEIKKYGIPNDYHYIDRSKQRLKKECYSIKLLSK